MARIGYARVSTTDQDLATQIDRLKAAGCDIIRSEKVSGASRDGRTELATILEFLRPGCELMVVRLDRLARSTRDVLNIMHECEKRGASLTVLDPPVSTKGETGRIVLTVLGMVAEMERRFIKERQREGIDKAKKLGVYKGALRRTDHGLVLKLHGEGKGPTEIAKALGISRMHAYRVIKASTPSSASQDARQIVRGGYRPVLREELAQTAHCEMRRPSTTSAS